MTQPPSVRSKVAQTLLIVWAVLASLMAALFAGLTFYFILRAPNPVVQQDHPTITNAFAAITEAEISGRYRLFEGENEIGTVILHPNGMATNWRGETKPGYHWKVQDEGLLLIWLKDYHLFTQIIRPGVYAGSKRSKSARMEREE